ncbi:Endonuclease/exonuclease/phosphatase, partial [Thalictrum thalictroides]
MTKIDRCLVDSAWLFSHPTSSAEFLPHGVSDHSPILVSWHDHHSKARPFRFSNHWIQHKDFKSVVDSVWDEVIYADPMNALSLKLKKLKERLRIWAKSNGTFLQKRVLEAKSELFFLQDQLQAQPYDAPLAAQERLAMKKYGTLARAELDDLQKKSDCMWLKFGDRCTSYYHNVIKERRNMSWIWSITTTEGNKLNQQNEVCAEFVQNYKGLMGTSATTNIPDNFYEQLDIK